MIEIDDDLLAYYQQELIYLRRLGAEFSLQHPKIAGRLGLGAHQVEDPHVARLMEAFAFGNARIRLQLDDEFPQISDALIEMLHPHFLAPLPSMSLIQLQPNLALLTGKKIIPANTRLVSAADYGASCCFTTRYPVEILPIFIEGAMLCAKPMQAPDIAQGINALSVLRIRLRCGQDSQTFAQLNFDELTFYISAQAQHAFALFELIFKHGIAIALADSPHDKAAVVLDKDCLVALGFAEDEGMLPYNKRTLMAYRLLTDFFAFPQKFLFFKLQGLSQCLIEKFKESAGCLEIYFYLSQHNPLLEKSINASSFALGCTPIINLFSSVAEPITLRHTQTEYQLVADAHKPPHATEIYAVQNVTATNETGEEMEFLPFYGAKHPQAGRYYHANRKAAQSGEHYAEQGSELFLSFTDLEFNPAQAADWIVSADILCTNRDMPLQLPFGGDEPRLQLLEQPSELINKIQCLTPMTPTRRPFLRHGARWRYITQFSLNHLSLSDDAEGIAALRSLLQLYDCDGHTQNPIFDGLLGVESTPVTLRNPNSQRGNVFWQGTRIKLTVDEAMFSGTSLYLLGCVLERFFALYTTLNSFTEFSIHSRLRGELHRWPPRAGDRPLL